MTKHFAQLCLIAFFSMLAFGCSKEQPANDQQISDNQQVTDMVKHYHQFLTAAKQKREGSWLKTERHFSFATAFDEIGGTLNYAYTFPANTNGCVDTYKVQISIPVSSQNDITETNLLDGYNDALDALRDEYQDMVRAGKTLIGVTGVNQGVINGNLVISLTALIGYGSPISSGVFDQSSAWRYSSNGGTCADPLSGEGATQVLERYLNSTCYRPGPGVHIWFWPQVKYEPFFSDFAMGGSPDNYLDYKIFYASSSVAPITDETRCLEYNQGNSGEHEMDFYLDGATELYEAWLQNTVLNPNKYRYIRCDIDSYEVFQGPSTSEIGHDEDFYFGEMHSIEIEEEDPGYPVSIL